MSNSFLLKVLSCAALMSLSSTESEARINCRGDFQVIDGNEISTPYCRDTHLARIARKSGIKVSDRDILYNPNVKREVCRLLYGNIDALPACEDVSSRRERY